MHESALSIVEYGRKMPDMKNPMKDYAQLIQEGAARAGLNQGQLAKELGISASVMNNWWQGEKKQAPTAELVRAIWRVLGISMRTQLETLGYLDRESNEPGVSYVLRSDDPRSRLLDMMSGLSPGAIDNVVRVVSVLISVTGGEARIDRTAAPDQLEPGA